MWCKSMESGCSEMGAYILILEISKETKLCLLYRWSRRLLSESCVCLLGKKHYKFSALSTMFTEWPSTAAPTCTYNRSLLVPGQTGLRTTNEFDIFVLRICVFGYLCQLCMHNMHTSILCIPTTAAHGPRPSHFTAFLFDQLYGPVHVLATYSWACCHHYKPESKCIYYVLTETTISSVWCTNSIRPQFSPFFTTAVK